MLESVQRRLYSNQLRTTRKAFYEAFRYGIFTAGRLATIELVPRFMPEKLQVNLLPFADFPPADDDIERLTGQLAELSDAQFEINVCRTLEDYCRVYCDRKPWRTSNGQSFMEHVVAKETSLRGSAPYRDVELVLPGGRIITRVDLVQPAADPPFIAQITVTDARDYVPGTTSELRMKKARRECFANERDQLLARACAFFEPHYAPLGRVKITGFLENGEWEIYAGLHSRKAAKSRPVLQPV